MTAQKKFKLEILRPFLESKSIALYVTATVIRRLKNNASDAFLEVVEQNRMSCQHCHGAKGGHTSLPLMPEFQQTKP